MPFQQFNPSLGTLTGVQVLVNGTLSGSISLENLGAIASTTTVGLPGSIVVSVADVSVGSIDFNSGTVATASLAAFDGTDNFAGSSGTVIAGTFSVGSMTGTVTDTPSLAQFVGTGTVDVSLTSGGSSNVASNATLLDLLDVNAGAVVTLQYQYVPTLASDSTDGTTSSGVLTLATNSSDLFIIPDAIYNKTTAPQTVTLPDQITGWSSIASVNKFDPSLGTLVAVEIMVGNDLGGSLSIENLSTQGSVIGLDQEPTVSVQAPGSGTLTPAEVVQNNADFLNLGPYDGTTNFAGSSGTIVALTAFPTAGSVPGGGELLDTADLADFTGTGTIGLAVSSSGQSDMTGSANLLSEIEQETGATISVTYDYVPSSQGDSIPCFASGTRIASPNGSVPVEQLRMGDVVRTVSGKPQPIQWIGSRRVDCHRHPVPDRVMPVRIAADAFGEDRPLRPVLLSPDHAVFVEDVLIPIKFLLNGDTITQIDVDSVTYYHVELAHHDVLLAEGLPVESYLETGGRNAFENSNGPIALHPDFAANEERVAELWREKGYAPLLGNEGQFKQARLKVLLQAQLLGSTQGQRTRRAASQ